jgi:hypothetical protein
MCPTVGAATTIFSSGTRRFKPREHKMMVLPFMSEDNMCSEWTFVAAYVLA